jgi:Acetyltransferase (GNAT) domain
MTGWRMLGTPLASSHWHDTADQLPGEWLAGTPYTTREWALAWREVRTEPVIESRFLHVEDGSGQTTVVPFYLVKNSPAWTAFEAEAGTGDIWGGRAVLYGPSAYATYGLEALSPSAIEAIVGRGLAWAREAGAVAAVFPGLRDPHAWTYAAGGIAIRTTGSHQALVRGSVDEFRKAIVKKGAREEFVRAHNRGNDAGLQLEILPGAEMLSLLPAYTKLASSASAKHGTALYGEDIFEAAAQVPGAVLLAAFHGTGLAGGLLCLAHGQTLYWWAGGLDYRHLGRWHTYRWLQYESIAYAASLGMVTVDAGRGNYDAKRRLGFTQLPLYAVCHLVTPDPGLAEALTGMGQRIAVGSVAGTAAGALAAR